MGPTERLDEQDIEASLERDRVGGHPLGHRVVREVVEKTPLGQQQFDGMTSE